MTKKKKPHRPHGHYCKICGEYKANEKFSGKGHAAHICKACSRLSSAEQAKAMTINRLMDFPVRRISAGEKSWLENRLHDAHTEVAELAREVYNLHFPYAERNAKKKQLVINTLSFEIHAEVFDGYGNELPVNRRFTAVRASRVLTMTDFDMGGETQTLTLEVKKMSTLLRWAVHSLEIFMWPEDYSLGPAKISADPYLDLLPEYRPDEAGEDDNADEDLFEEGEVRWRVEIEYAGHTAQEIVSYLDFLPERPEELYLALLAYFEPETEDLDGEYSGDTPLE